MTVGYLMSENERKRERLINSLSTDSDDAARLPQGTLRNNAVPKLPVEELSTTLPSTVSSCIPLSTSPPPGLPAFYLMGFVILTFKAYL